MNTKLFIGILSLLIITMMITGCGNTGTSSVKASQFGKTQKDTSLLTAATAKFGELGKSTTPRILNPLVTTGIVDFLPVDNVQAYSKDAKELHVWFIYDSFNNGDTGTITWKYLDTNEIVATDNIVLTTSSDMKYGRYAGDLIAPDGGWPIGKYSVVISIKGIDATVNFEVVNGNTVSQEFNLGGNTAVTSDDNAVKTGTSTTTSTTYSDPNYPFKIDAVPDYKYSVQSGNVVFKSPTKDMYYIVEVIKSVNTGGTFSSAKDIASDYFGRFSDYNPTFPGDNKKTIDGKTALDTSVQYTTTDGKYTNRFIIGDGGNYFYVLQFVTPNSELNADQTLIEKVISSFKFTVEGKLNTNTKDTSPTTTTTTTPTPSTTTTTTTPAASTLETAQKCYDDNYKKKIDDAYAANAAATTWDSYFEGIGADSDCSAQLKVCSDAIDSSHAYDDSYFANPDDLNNWPMNVLRVEQMKVCYNRAVACNDLAYKKICNNPNPTLKTIANVAESYCNQKYSEMLKGFRDQIPLIKAGNDGQPIYKIESCYNAYKSCTSAATSTDYTAMADCASAEFDCAAPYYATICHTMATQ